MKNTFYFIATLSISIFSIIALIILLKGIAIKHCYENYHVEACKTHSFRLVENSQKEVINGISCAYCDGDNNQCIRRKLNQQECAQWLEMMKDYRE